MTSPDACTIDCNANFTFNSSTNSCVPILRCGDLICNNGENDNACSVDCNPVCGNSVIEAGELCDNSAVTNGVCDMTSPDACTIDCNANFTFNSSTNSCVPIPRCGDLICNNGENDNTCSVDCNPVCGNSVIEAGELCDNSAVTDGVCDMSSPDACTIDCSAGYTLQDGQCVQNQPICGDNIINQGFEECDGTSGTPANGICSASCNIACNSGYSRSGNQCVLICGNGVCGAGENDN